MEEVRISPTMLGYWSEEGRCPEKVRATYIDREIEFVPSEPMILGSWMEYLMIGTTTQGEKEPEGITDKMKNSAAGKRIVIQAAKWEKIKKRYKITDIQLQVKKKVPVHLEFGKYESTVLMSGIYDILCKVDGRKAIIDIKYSGNALSMWGDFGWGNPQGMDLKQSMHYPMMELHDTGEVVDFYYFIFDSTPQMNFRPLKINVTGGSLKQYMLRVQTAWVEVMRERLRKGKHFSTNPSTAQCFECPLMETCKDYREFPDIIQIGY